MFPNFFKYFLIVFFLIFNFSFSQKEYEFYGALQLNGKQEQSISYKLNFHVNKGKVYGYSITDITGEHETKNVISGFYDSKTKTLQFKEEEILYTKSLLSENSFCFVNFKGKVDLDSKNTIIKNDFQGLFKNKKRCIDGILTLVNVEKIEKVVTKVDKKIQRSKKVDTATKEKYSPIKIYDSLKVNYVKANQNINLFFKGNKVELKIWDVGKEDGDIIDLFQDEKILLKDYTTTKEIKIIPVNLKNKSEYKITAKNIGTIGLNTPKIEVSDGERKFELMINLKTNESAKITIIKNEPN